MAAYTSTQSGDWNNAATWGGGGYPNLAGDTATIAAGHTVTYNVSSTTELGAISVSGILKFNESMNTKLTLSSNSITVNNGGELRVGNSATPIGSAYLAELVFNTATDNAKGISVAAGGKIYMQGTDVTGGTPWSSLASDWNSGQTLSVVGDLTAKWAVGQTIAVHRYPTSATADDCPIYTIASLTLNGGNTDIVINEAAPGITHRKPGLVLNLTRNVVMQKSGAATTIGSTNTNRPYLVINDTNSGNSIIKHVLFIGTAGVQAAGYSVFENIVTRNGYATFGGTVSTFFADIKNVIGWSNAGGIIFVYESVLDGIILADTQGTAVYTFRGVANSRINNLHAFGGEPSTYVSSQVWATVFTDCSFYGNTRNIYYYDYGNQTRYVNCYFDCSVLDPTVQCPSSYCIQVSGAPFEWDNCYVYGGGTTDPTITAWNPASLALGFRWISRNHNQVEGAFRDWAHYHKMWADTGVVRTGGMPYSLKVESGSNIGQKMGEPLLEWVELEVPAGWKTRSVYIRGGGFATWPVKEKLYLQVTYNDGTSTFHRAVIRSTAVLTDNTTWVPFSVTFNQKRRGDVHYRLFYSHYAASTNIYVDPMLVVEGES